MKKKIENLKIETLTAHLGKNPFENHGIPSPPVYRTSTILRQSMESFRNKDAKYTYGRNGTPTSDLSQTQLQAYTKQMVAYLLHLE